jgi:hypothetical protein
VKIWGATDPRFLNRKHLLGEHQEIHTCLAGATPQHCESLMVRFGGDERWPAFRHELLRLEMDRRWPGRHDPYVHPSKVDDDILRSLSNTQRSIIDDYEDAIHSGRWTFGRFVIRDDGVVEVDMDFTGLMDEIGFPGPVAPIDYDTPWQRDRMTFSDYMALGDKWTAEYKFGDRPSHSAAIVTGWTRRPTDEAMDRLTDKGIVYFR